MPTTLVLAQHHHYCDDLFADAEGAAAAEDWERCAERLQRFADEMNRHFGAEETILFPAFEQATGMTGGPTQMMRMEHEQMRALLGSLAAATERRDVDGFSGAAQTLLILLQQHNLKEENILYPMCDQHLDCRAAVGDGLKAAVEAMAEAR